jgi:hypothetical protein
MDSTMSIELIYIMYKIIYTTISIELIYIIYKIIYIYTYYPDLPSALFLQFRHPNLGTKFDAIRHQ